METGEAPQSSGGGSRRRARIEVFEAFLEDTDLRIWSYVGVFGVVILRSCNHDFLIFDSSAREPQPISPEGFLPLTDPDLLTLTDRHCSVPVEDVIHLRSWFFVPVVLDDVPCEDVLWNVDDNSMDRLICRTFECLPSKLHVSFAVYRDPVEAHLDIYFVDLEYGEEDASLIQVEGTVTASNNFLRDSKAKSVLFHKWSGQCVSLKAGNSIPLTLSRRMTVIPRKSTLLVHVDLQVCMGHGHPTLPFEGMLEFNPGPDYAEQFIIPPNCGGKLLVKVTWVECEDRLEE